jgi:D-alanyl-D-alanine-carboxypeptidase/D-alanyl-D-alanine-endopeptidase
MFNRRTILCAALPGAFLALSGATSSWAAAPADSEIQDAMAQAIDQKRIGAGMVAGIVDAKGRRVLTHGASDAADGRALGADTVFDIGSLTKLFTALALADMVVKGKMAMADPLSKYLPPDIAVPDFEGRPVTLLDIATYSPGLPEWPLDMPKFTPAPLPDYPVARLYAALSGTKLDAAPGSHYVYSNFGYGLLGLALAQRADMDFESLIVSSVCKPLGMESTRIAVTPALAARVAPGHMGPKVERVTSWNLPPAFQGAGAFRSTAHDLMNFLEAAMGRRKTTLAPAFAAMRGVERASDKPDTKVAAGWFLTEGHGDRLVWKDGGVLGYASFLGFSNSGGNGVVLLVNGIANLVDLGKHLLDADFPAG